MATRLLKLCKTNLPQLQACTKNIAPKMADSRRSVERSMFQQFVVHCFSISVILFISVITMWNFKALVLMH